MSKNADRIVSIPTHILGSLASIENKNTDEESIDLILIWTEQSDKIPFKTRYQLKTNCRYEITI